MPEDSVVTSTNAGVTLQDESAVDANAQPQDASAAASGGAGGAAGGGSLVVPADIQQRFGDLIDMIKKSRSMNDEERQYWVDALSIMSEDQIQNLRGILENEQKQIQQVEQKYANQVDEQVEKRKANFDSEAYLEKKRARVEAEKLSEHEEKEHEEALLAALEEL